mgnify:CR=1 FL=1
MASVRPGLDVRGSLRRDMQIVGKLVGELLMICELSVTEELAAVFGPP